MTAIKIEMEIAVHQVLIKLIEFRFCMVCIHLTLRENSNMFLDKSIDAGLFTQVF